MKQQDGFTLLEIMFVVVIYGLIMTMIISSYESYLREKAIETTKVNISKANGQLGRISVTRGRYLCPSKRGLSTNDPEYGIEFCDVTAIPLNSCREGICLVEGTRDTNYNPPAALNGESIPGELVLIGGVPVETIRDITNIQYSNEEVYDGWGSELTYAVTYSLTDNNTYQFNNGLIQALDELGNPTAGIENNGHYAVISHGENKKGAFTTDMNGAYDSPYDLGFACEGTEAVEGDGDNENCDLNATFVQNLRQSRGANARYNDDYITFNIQGSGDLWTFIPAQTNGSVTPVSTGRVGVKTNEPEQRLHVEGGLRLNWYLRAIELCDDDDTARSRCLSLEDLNRGNMNCPNEGEVIVGISNGQLDCEEPTFTTNVTECICSPGWMVGISNEGQVICNTGPCE